MHGGATCFESVHASRHLVPEKSSGSGVLYTYSGQVLLLSIYGRTDVVADMQQPTTLDYACASRRAANRHCAVYGADVMGP